jgi:hypothetical protein
MRREETNLAGELEVFEWYRHGPLGFLFKLGRCWFMLRFLVTFLLVGSEIRTYLRKCRCEKHKLSGIFAKEETTYTGGGRR